MNYFSEGLSTNRRGSLAYRPPKKSYARVYLRAVLPPLLSHGVCMEAHMQNLLTRFDAVTGGLRGFVYRDMGGLRMHVPTLAARGLRVRSASLVPGAVTLTDDLGAVWVNAYHNLENHLGGALRALGLGWEDGAGWPVVREELAAALRACPDPDGKADEMLAFMSQPTMKRKAFLRMKIAGVYRGVSIAKRRPVSRLGYMLMSLPCLSGFIVTCQILWRCGVKERTVFRKTSKQPQARVSDVVSSGPAAGCPTTLIWQTRRFLREHLRLCLARGKTPQQGSGVQIFRSGMFLRLLVKLAATQNRERRLGLNYVTYCSFVSERNSTILPL